MEFQWIHGVYLLVAIISEVIANLFLKYSDGFHKRLIGILGIFSILIAFSALAQAVKGIDLAVAYAVWGAIGLVLTIGMGWVLFKQRLNAKGWYGIGLLIAGMTLLKLA